MTSQSPNQLDATVVSEQPGPMPFTAVPRIGGPELSVIVPTFNERDNIEPS